MKESSLKGKLRRLGSNPKAIAATLRKRGIKGVTGECRLCPIANFLAKTTKGAIYVDVTGVQARVAFLDGNSVCATLPLACQDFVEAFDDGVFPKLKCSFEEAQAERR